MELPTAGPSARETGLSRLDAHLPPPSFDFGSEQMAQINKSREEYRSYRVGNAFGSAGEVTDIGAWRRRQPITWAAPATRDCRQRSLLLAPRCSEPLCYRRTPCRSSPRAHLVLHRQGTRG